MPGILFTNIWMLAGLAALSIPVVIHLLLRRKKKKARFSTLQFFVRQDEQSSQRRKLRHWLLLALRLGIFALLVLAFARPYLQNQGAANSALEGRRVILVLDRSLSMQASTMDGSKWVRAKESAQRILSELKPQDQAALIGCGARAEVLSPWAPASVVSKTLKDLEATFGRSSLGEGLQAAKRLVSVSDSAAAATIYLVSDLQRQSCHDLAASPLPPEIEVRTIPVGDLLTPNLGVVNLETDQNAAVRPHAVLASFSDENVPDLPFDLNVDGNVISSASLPLNAGTSTNINLAIPGLKPGWHDIAVRVRGRDALPSDDARFQSIFIPQPARALVVETRPTTRIFEEESFFLTTALDPGKGSTNGVQSRFAFEKISVEALTSQLAATNTPLPWDLVVLPGLRQLSSAVAKSLVSYAERGGGLLLFVGEGVSANRYNAEFRPMLPFQLGAAETPAGLESAWRIGNYNTNTLIFSAFQLPNSGNLALPRFLKRFQWAVDDPKDVVARFDDGTPLMIAGDIGLGRFVLVNSSADTSWNDWPKHKSFVPWLHGASLYLAHSSRRNEAPVPLHGVAGESSDIEMGSAAQQAQFKLRSAAGREWVVTADQQGLLRDVSFPEPGVYSLHAESGVEVRRIAVNVPPSESDLASFTAHEVQQQLTRLPEARQSSLAAGLLGATSNQREFWRVLLLMVLVLLVAEMLLANRTLA